MGEEDKQGARDDPSLLLRRPDFLNLTSGEVQEMTRDILSLIKEDGGT